MENYTRDYTERKTQKISPEEAERLLGEEIRSLLADYICKDKTIDDFLREEKQSHAMFNLYLKFLSLKTNMADGLRKSTTRKMYVIKILNGYSNFVSFLASGYYRVSQITGELSDESDKTLYELKRNKEAIKAVRNVIRKLKGHDIPSCLPPLDELTDLIFQKQINIDEYLAQIFDIATFEIKGITYIPAGDPVRNMKEKLGDEIDDRVVKLGLKQRRVKLENK
jgi:hypothetical protein